MALTSINRILQIRFDLCMAFGLCVTGYPITRAFKVKEMKQGFP